MPEPASSDSMERLVEEALLKAGISYLAEANCDKPSGLDFRLPDHGIEIEVKRFHSDRIAAQTARAPNVIALQGEAAVRFFCSLLAEDRAPG